MKDCSVEDKKGGNEMEEMQRESLLKMEMELTIVSNIRQSLLTPALLSIRLLWQHAHSSDS